MINKLCVAGAGTMGNGIALAAAQHGIQTVLFDINEAVVQHAVKAIHANLDFLVNKQKITPSEKETILQRISFSSSLTDCTGDIVIEAIIEKLEIKQDLFQKLAGINEANTILASNTSSLSISAIQAAIPNPGRVAGMHFFNPAHVMKLVEVIKGEQTSDDVADQLIALCKRMGKVAVLCTDVPGFIVNRVARPYYLEAMHLVSTGKATIESVDRAMEAAGFKMGPFRLMDLIGLDINLAVSTSVYEAMNQEERFKPSPLQVEKVSKGELGRKSGKGFYNYN